MWKDPDWESLRQDQLIHIAASSAWRTARVLEQILSLLTFALTALMLMVGFAVAKYLNLF